MRRERASIVTTIAVSLFAAATLVAPSAVGNTDDAAPTVIFLVRHAEKASPTSTEDAADPPLTDVGRVRAKSLAHVLADAGITQIFSSDLRRTRQTAVPLAELRGLEIEVYDPYALGELAARLRTLPGRHLVSGHSNTTPELVGLLGGEPGSPIEEAWEYDRLYVLVIGKDGSVTTQRLRYGRPSESEQPGPTTEPDDPDPTQPVVEAFERVRAAMMALDTDPLRDLVAEDYEGSDARGRLHDRATLIEVYGPGGVELDVFEIEDRSVRLIGDTALVSGIATIHGHYGDVEFGHRLRFLDVYAERDGTWKVVASQVTDLVLEAAR